MEMAVGDHMTEVNKLLINKWRDSAFPLGKDDGAVHKEALRAILYEPCISAFMKGVPQASLFDWIKKQWLMPAVQIWLHILLKYESMSENISGNFIEEYNTTTALGLRSAGADKLNIGELDHSIVHQLETVKKAFTTVAGLTEHLRVCALLAAIKDGAEGTGLVTDAWRVARDHLISNKSRAFNVEQPISLAIVQSTVRLAQHHLETIPPDYKEPKTDTFKVTA
eukprot:1928034-Rhodomonas_salina.1